MATAKLSSLVSKSTESTKSNSKEDQMATSTAPKPKYAVITLSGKTKEGEAWGSHWLISAQPLTEAECAKMLKSFDVAVAGKPRKSFERKFFRGMTAVLAKASLPGGAMYWLADDGMTGLDVVKTMVEEVLGSAKGKPAAQKAQDASTQPKAASKGKNGKNTKGQAAQAGKAKAKAAARQFDVVLG